MRTSTLSAAVISLMLLVAACSGTSSTGTGSPSAAASLPTFRLVDFPGDVFFTDVVAQKQGFFAKAESTYRTKVSQPGLLRSNYW